MRSWEALRPGSLLVPLDGVQASSGTVGLDVVDGLFLGNRMSCCGLTLEHPCDPPSPNRLHNFLGENRGVRPHLLSDQTHPGAGFTLPGRNTPAALDLGCSFGLLNGEVLSKGWCASPKQTRSFRDDRRGPGLGEVLFNKKLKLGPAREMGQE